MKKSARFISETMYSHMSLVDKFEEFLQSVDLGAYREKYRLIKIVEMDLPKDMQAIELLYKIYWQERNSGGEFPDYDNFYREYFKKYKKEILAFQRKTGMCLRCFRKGLPARIYRTWASIITQIHAGYVAESVFGQGTVDMSAELDHQGADFQVKYRGRVLNYQVKKKTFSREVRQAKTIKDKIRGEFLDIFYEVPPYERIRNPYQKDGKKYYSDYITFKEKFLDAGALKVLENGFVVFTPLVFENKKKELENL